MKTLPPQLQAHLETRATTLAWCWRLARLDGVRLGFTDHDRDITFDGTTFEAASGFTASDMEDGVGLSAGNLEVDGALTSSTLDEGDLAAGRYDGARVEVWRVNWAAPEQRVLMRSGTLGDVSRSGTAFRAEIRGLAEALQQPHGRLYQYACDADLGDRRCGVDVTGITYQARGEIAAATDGRFLSVALPDAYAAGWFARGRLAFESGANAGRRQEIRYHGNGANNTVDIELWQPFAHAIARGDRVTLTAGCDKHFATCRAKFNNTVNFRGFPHIPGVDALSMVAGPGKTRLTGQ